MTEHPAEMIQRLMMMANGDPAWDLSNKDRAAIQHALDRMRTAESAIPESFKRGVRETRDTILEHIGNMCTWSPGEASMQKLILRWLDEVKP
jgi:hypothetical protein